MTKQELLREVSLFLLDLDGTVYLGDRPIGAMRKTLSALRGMGKQLVFLTNNSSRTEEEYREKLTRIGLFSAGDGVYTSGMATAEYLQVHYPGRRVFLVATDAVRAEFEKSGVVLDAEAPEVAVLAYDTELTFPKIRLLDRFLRAGIPFLATHPDDVCPTEDGSMPDVGAFLAMFARASHRTPDAIIGKPYAPMGEGLVRKYGVPRERMCMVGDRMHTDIRFANNNKMRSILVLSGETTERSMAQFPDVPDLVLPDFNHIFG